MTVVVSQRPLVLEPVDGLEDLRPGWSALAAASGNVFATWEWTALWWRYFGRGRELALAAATNHEGRLAAIVPLYVWAIRPGRVLRFMGHGVSDQLGPICPAGDEVEASQALAAHLRTTGRRWDVVLAENLPGGQDWPRVLGGRLLRREASPLLRADGWESYFASRSPKLRAQIGRRTRKLGREHEVRFRLADDPARLDADLDTLFALHAARWPGRQSAFAGPREAFHRDFAAAALARRWLRLWFLEVDGGAVAAWYGFRFAGVESYYQAGRDPAWDHRSVGTVLLAHSIRTALEEGVTEYRLLRGDEAYKVRFATDDSGLQTVGVAAGARGRSLVAAAGLLRSSSRLRKSLRAWFDA